MRPVDSDRNSYSSRTSTEVKRFGKTKTCGEITFHLSLMYVVFRMCLKLLLLLIENYTLGCELSFNSVQELLRESIRSFAARRTNRD